MMTRTFLSIDLDYWCRSEKRQCDAFFKKVYALRLPIHVACEHHHLLDSMNSSQCDTLINVDWHSDLCDTPDCGWKPSELEDGTWGNFISWRERGTFIWRYPTHDCLNVGIGYCHDLHNPFEEPVSGWHKVQKRWGVGGIPWDSIKAVGVCLSPRWIGLDSVIQGPITRLGMQDWLDLDQLGYFVPDPIVRIVRPDKKKVRKRRLSTCKSSRVR